MWRRVREESRAVAAFLFSQLTKNIRSCELETEIPTMSHEQQPGARRRHNEQAAPPDNGSSGVSSEGVRLVGPEGRANAIKLAELAMGVLSSRELGDPRFSRKSDGGVEVLVDSKTFEAFTSLSG